MSTTSEDQSDILLMDENRVQRSVNRMAHQIAEENRDQSDILLVGIKERGHTIASLLGKKLKGLTKRKIAIQQLGVEADHTTHFDVPDLQFPYVVLVDDVIFSGRTMLAALQALLDKIQPEKVRTAVLVDRGHRTYPVDASYAGMELPTKLNEHVEVQTESSHINKVVLNNRTG